MKYWTYGMRLRGFSIGCQPMDGFLERKDDPEGKYHDLLVYDRCLTDEEQEQYELDFIDGRVTVGSLKFDRPLLEEEMHGLGDTIRSLADGLNVSRQNLSQVFNGKHDFTYPQLIAIASRYQLSPERFFEIFILPTVDDYF